MGKNKALAHHNSTHFSNYYLVARAHDEYCNTAPHSTRVDEGRKHVVILLAINTKTLLYRGGEGGGRRARYATPDLSYYWWKGAR